MKKNETEKYLINVATPKERVVIYFLFFLWILSVTFFWRWWFSSDYTGIESRFVLNTLLLLWATLLPMYYLYFVAKMKKPNPEIKPLTYWRVAMIVTRAPSEPFDVVKETLLAMLGQEFPHDTWLADEMPTEEIWQWCKEHNVQLSSRHNIHEYHNHKWPRRTKCKEGNLAYFYDNYGYKKYDIVVQLDADHRPKKGYLIEMIRPFVNPDVGYVSAPSICDTNADSSWAVRMRLFAEGTMHGSLQAGYSDGWAPLCIGSHYAVRTKALKEIGGIGPELAEDHSTSLMMNAHGWKGVHAFEAEASGDGPLTFKDCMTQEYQWSKSLVVILLTVLPKYWKKLPPKLRFQFLFSESWYPMFAIYMLLGFLIPVFALVTKTTMAKIGYVDFLIHSLPSVAVLILVVLWVKSRGWLRPKNSKIFAWEFTLFEIARWPWVLSGTFMAFYETIFDKKVIYKITPKGKDVSDVVSIRDTWPYIIIILISLSAVIMVNQAGSAKGYYFFAMINAFMYLSLLMTVTWKKNV